LNNQKAETNDNFLAMILDQINVIQSDNDCRVISAFKHVCKDRSFKTFMPIEDVKVLYINNTSFVNVKGVGQVESFFTSSKTLILNDIK